jgi:hypothetical protein
MCYSDRRTWRARAQACEEGRRVWDLFDRETRADPPQPVAETERAHEGDEAVAAEPEREPTATSR